MFNNALGTVYRKTMGVDDCWNPTCLDNEIVCEDVCIVFTASNNDRGYKHESGISNFSMPVYSVCFPCCEEKPRVGDLIDITQNVNGEDCMETYEVGDVFFHSGIAESHYEFNVTKIKSPKNTNDSPVV